MDMKMQGAFEPRPYWNPYLAGVALGLVLLGSFLVMGFGLGSSSAATRLAYGALHAVVPAATEANAYMGPYVTKGAVLMDWMVFEVLGVVLGGIVAAYSAGRMRGPAVDRGAGVGVAQRLLFAVLGGILMGFAARLARGCTSGQALTGGTALALGSWAFMIACFAGGYFVAPFVRRMWR